MECLVSGVLSDLELSEYYNRAIKAMMHVEGSASEIKDSLGDYIRTHIMPSPVRDALYISFNNWPGLDIGVAMHCNMLLGDLEAIATAILEGREDVLEKGGIIIVG